MLLCLDDPQQWVPGLGNNCADLSNWPASTECRTMRSFLQYLIALDVTKSATRNAQMVKWSHGAAAGAVPSSWDETDPATSAGEITLAETQGEIITVALLNNSTLIYKEDSVISMRFVGGQSVFAFDTVFSQFGALSRNSVAILENSHLVVTQGDVILHNGATFASVINKKNKALLFNNMDSGLLHKTTLQVRIDRNEVWICYADTDNQGYINKALVWNYEDDVWGFRDMQEFSHVASGFIDTSTISLIIDDQSARTYDTFLETYDAQAATPVFDDLAVSDAVNSKIFKLNSSQQFDGTNIACRLERTGLTIIGRDRQGNWKTDTNSRKFVRRLIPKILSSGPIDIYVGGQELPNSGVVWQGPFVFDPATDHHIDCMVNTRYVAVRFESNANIAWQLQGYNLELDILGQAPR